MTPTLSPPFPKLLKFSILIIIIFHLHLSLFILFLVIKLQFNLRKLLKKFFGNKFLTSKHKNSSTPLSTLHFTMQDTYGTDKQIKINSINFSSKKINNLNLLLMKPRKKSLYQTGECFHYFFISK